MTCWKASQDNERGGVTVIVALLMVVLLGFTALTVDVGVLYSERAQLQNGADASAIGIAQKCARNLGDAACSADSPLATSFANQNALDGRSNVQSISLDTIARKVTVQVSARETGAAANSVSLYFARALGMASAEVGARSSAVWGSPVKGPAPFPITVSICQVRDKAGVMQLLQLHGKLKNEGCNYGPSGAPVPGGFGGLEQDSGACAALIDINLAEGGGDTGNNPPPGCEDLLYSWAADINAGKDVIVLLPVFNSVTGSGTGAIYRMTTFAAFKVAGWKFSGGSTLPYTFHNRAPDVPAALECREAIQCKGIIGTFVKHVSLVNGYTLGPVNADGATIVGMTS
jgi:hypothetical protein